MLAVALEIELSSIDWHRLKFRCINEKAHPDNFVLWQTGRLKGSTRIALETIRP